jgi:hypothetical protein
MNKPQLENRSALRSVALLNKIDTYLYNQNASKHFLSPLTSLLFIHELYIT